MKKFLSKFFVNDISKDQIKDTGMAMVLILLIMGFFFKNIIFFKIAILVLIVNMVIPNIYKYVAIFWFGISHLLGTVVSKIILTLIFFIVVTPMGLFRRLIGIDSLKLKEFKRDNKSVMRIRNHTFFPNDMEKPF